MGGGGVSTNLTNVFKSSGFFSELTPNKTVNAILVIANGRLCLATTILPEIIANHQNQSSISYTFHFHPLVLLMVEHHPTSVDTEVMCNRVLCTNKVI